MNQSQTEPNATSIRLLSGGYLDLANPQQGNFRIDDIATSLANTSRFTGQLVKFYSVAEHCVHCLSIAGQLDFTAKERRAVLMHDAAEAYVGDVSSPLKRLLPNYKHVEESIQIAINHQFGITTNRRIHNRVKRVDLLMLKVEKLFFYGSDDLWEHIEDLKDYSSVIRIRNWTPTVAWRRFIEACEDYGIRDSENQVGGSAGGE